jgi:hypothetical protein
LALINIFLNFSVVSVVSEFFIFLFFILLLFKFIYCFLPPSLPRPYTEVSAASGCLFVGLGASALILNEPLGWMVVGFAYAGAAIGRITSIFRDNAASRKSWTFFGCEAALAGWLVLANM